MSRDKTPVRIPRELLMDVYREARKAFPAECCGWLSGPKDGSAVSVLHRSRNAQASGEHPSQQERSAETAYVIAGDDLLAFARSLETDEPARIIYHSHPNGRAYFSRTDQEVAASPWGDGPAYPVEHLVVGIDASRVTEAALFAWSDEAGAFAEVARFEGADV